ncbi:S-layer homology domain-containing protein [Caldalkalibacillus mannanilyticus]|uniref:S-layer homology domain-containing protein n=1 Tax=Caldalkalibacillus mannanilyticus TaxID=1418 RepID=UPI00046A3621|nr:S-layer homology domain-containing protein [Caldalkalibacillus mannanilyticus]
MVTGLVNHFTKFAVIDRTKLETANEQAKVKEQIKETAQFLTKHQEGSEWALFALARAGAPVAHRSIEQLEREVQENQGTYRNVTDIERLVLTLSALGKDPRVFAGYDLIEKLYQHERMTHQGSNGLIFALIALDSKSYELPSHATWTRERIIAELLSYQNSTGAFSLAKGHENNVDITAMALAALAPYQKQKEVKEAVDKAVKWLSTEQQANGGYRQDMVESSESIAQVVIGLTALGIDPVGEAFTKEKGHLLTRLFAFKNTDGGFATQVGKASDQMPTEQALMALVAYERFLAGQSRLYDLKEINVGSQLPNGETEKKALFADDALISPYAYEAVYRALELRIFEGVSKDELRFAPKQDLTRAQFTKVILQLMKEEPAGQGNGNHPFVDVTPDAWYFHNVTRAAELGIVQGTAPTTFDPHASITREHLALMIGRALKLDASASGHQYKDIQHLSSESQAYIAVLHERGIMIGNGEKFHPHQKVTREMAAVIAVRLYEMMNP